MIENPDFSPPAARAMHLLTELHDIAAVKHTAAVKYGAIVFGALDVEPEGITASRIGGVTGINHPQISEILKAFRMRELLIPHEVTPSTPRTRGLPVTYAMTPALVDFAADYNRLFAEHVQQHCPQKMTLQALALRAVRSYATTQDLAHTPAEDFRTIVDRLVEHTGAHPQSIIYRSIGTCAFGMGILRNAENDISRATRQWKDRAA